MHVQRIYEISEEQMSEYTGSRIFQVSNRVVEPKEDEHGNLLKVASGGLDEAIARPFGNIYSIRVGWNGETVDADPENFDWRKHVKIKHYQTDDGPISYCTAPLPQKILDDYYNGLNNRFTWMLNHELIDRATQPYLVKDAGGNLVFDEKIFMRHVAAARQANRIFAEMISETFSLKPDDTVIGHDSHVGPLANILRNELDQDCAMGFFLHTPQVDPKLLDRLSDVQKQFVLKTLREDILAYDFAAFQSKEDVQHFGKALDLKLPQDIKPYESYEISGNFPNKKGFRGTRIGTFPVVGNYDLYPAQAAAARKQAIAYLRKFGITPKDFIIFSGGVRADVTKGIPTLAKGICAAAWKLASQNAGLQRGRTIFVQQTQRTRPGVKDYDNEYFEIVRTHTRLRRLLPHGWEFFLDAKGRDRKLLLALSVLAGIVAHTPKKDGYNLAACEQTVVQHKKNPATLVISHGAGAGRHIGEKGAVIVNGKRRSSVTAGIVKAKWMSPLKKVEMHKAAMKQLKQVSNAEWQCGLYEGTRRGYLDNRNRASPSPECV